MSSELDRLDVDVASIREAFLYVAPVHASVARDAEIALERLVRLAHNTFKWADAIDANWEGGGNDWWATLMEIRSYRTVERESLTGQRTFLGKERRDA
jgi:hypothetical protein